MKPFNLLKQSNKIFTHSIGVLFVYTIIFEIITEYIFLPVSRVLFSMSLKTVDEGFISNQNFTDLFKHPLVLITGLISVVAFCLINLWETAGLVIIIEYAYRGKPVRLFEVIYKSVDQVKHCMMPKNWFIFLYLMIIEPIMDADFSSTMVSSFTMPEFIMDYIRSKIGLYVLYFALAVIIFIVFVRFLFLPYVMILERKNFKEANKKASLLVNGKYLRTYIETGFVSLIFAFVIWVAPTLITYILQYIMLKLFGGYEYAHEISKYVFDGLSVMLVEGFRDIYIKIYIAVMIVLMYHHAIEEANYEDEVTIPEECEKKEGKIYRFNKFAYFLYISIFIFDILLFMMFTVGAEYSPEVMKDLVSSTKIAAHKGYSSQAPENTLPSFKRAVECDIVDYIELDVRETKDGIPVVIHDESILAATGQNVSVYDITFEELNKIPATYSFGEEFIDTRIPTLEEVLDKYGQGKKYIIEIKDSDYTPELPYKIVSLMDKYKLTDSSVIHSGSYRALKAVKQINENIPCGLIIAVSTGGYADLPYADFFSVEHSYISSHMIEQIHNRGKEIYVWTVNEESSFNQVRNMNVDVVITDYPEDAYNGIHKYDIDLLNKLSDTFENMDVVNDLGLNGVDYNGTGD